MELHNLVKLKSSENKKKRVGRGGGSGKGWHTTGKGNKGQKARSNQIPTGFEGGQVPLYKKLPQMGGFKSTRAKRIIALPLDVLNFFAEGSTVDKHELAKAGFIAKTYKGKIKLLSKGDLNKKLNLKGFLVSDSAKQKLENSGATFLDA